MLEKVMQWLLEHSDPLRNYAIIVGGVIGLYFAWLRVSASNKQADAQIRQAQLARQDHVAELFNRAASQLKDEKLEVRLAAILTLRQICDDFDDLSDPSIRLLTTIMTENPINYGNKKVPADVQEIMLIIQRRGRKEVRNE
jgi:hypothetical protein